MTRPKAFREEAALSPRVCYFLEHHLDLTKLRSSPSIDSRTDVQEALAAIKYGADIYAGRVSATGSATEVRPAVELLTPEQAARRLNTNADTIRRACREGRLIAEPHDRGKPWRIRSTDLEICRSHQP